MADTTHLTNEERGSPAPSREEPPRSPSRLRDICETIERDGLAPAYAALLAGLTRPEFAAWLREDPTVAEALARARAAWLRDRLEKIRTAAGRDGATDWRAQAYLLDKAPGTVLAEEEQSGTADPGTAERLVITPELLAELQSRRQAALAKHKR